MRIVAKASVVGAALALALLPTDPALAEREPGPSPMDGCSAQNLVADVAPTDAQGTTFVGSYLGDSLGGRDMPAFWSVERVYAGGPAPEDLIFSTPECLWTNLTPDTRYLFSTAATNLDFTNEAGGTPSVKDSLAWEMLDTGDVRLAPFDTYEAEDYSSDALLAITTFDEALYAVAPNAGDGEPPAEPLNIDFGCAATWFSPETLEDASGTAFIGTYIGQENLAGGGIRNRRVYWSVDRVYAGGPLPEVLTLRTSGCLPVTLKPGKRYLFTTSDIAAPSASDSYAWRLRKGGGIKLAPFGTLDRESGPKEARALTTLDDALRAIAPNAGVGDAPMRAADRTPG